MERLGDYEIKRAEQDLELTRRTLAILALGVIDDAYIEEEE